MRRANFLSVLAAALGIACGSTPTSPTTTDTTTTTTTTVASPTTTETFADTLPVGGFKFYSFTVGTVNVTLAAVAGNFVPSTVQLGLGIGQPSGADCATTTSLTAASGSTAQLTGTYAPAVYCVRVYDIGNLFAPAQFGILIAHP